MITHNGKQVTLAMRNRKAINLIARNGKAMFGEFSDVNTDISFAAKAVILAEYGLVVWDDVKQYAKAHPQIVEFINQDPHLACSISTNSAKIRGQKPNGNAYYDTGYYANGNTGFYIDFESVANTSMCVFGGRTMHNQNSYALTPYRASGYEGQFYYAGSDTNSKVMYNAEIYRNERCIVEYDAETHTFTNALGNKISTTALDFTCEYSIYVFADNQKNSMIEHFDGTINKLMFYEGGEPVRHFVPYRDPSTGEMELLDLVTATLATRFGTFTEVIEDKA